MPFQFVFRWYGTSDWTTRAQQQIATTRVRVRNWLKELNYNNNDNNNSKSKYIAYVKNCCRCCLVKCKQVHTPHEHIICAHARSTTGHFKSHAQRPWSRSFINHARDNRTVALVLAISNSNNLCSCCCCCWCWCKKQTHKSSIRFSKIKMMMEMCSSSNSRTRRPKHASWLLCV